MGVLIGSSTGRDGIGGVSVLASQEFDETSAEKRPSVQVGDPFTEKLEIEACLEMLDKGLLLGLQDLGGAGLTCATCETAERGGCGMDVDVGKGAAARAGHGADRDNDVGVPGADVRDLQPGEPRGGAGYLREVGARRDTARDRSPRETGCRLFLDGEVIADVPASSLAQGPEYHRAAEKPAYLDEVQAFDLVGAARTGRPRARRC